MQKSSIIEVKIIPNASHNAIVGLENGILKIRIAAQPEKNKANRALVKFLAEFLGVRQADIILISGGTIRHKKLHIPLSWEEVLHKLSNS